VIHHQTRVASRGQKRVMNLDSLSFALIAHAFCHDGTDDESDRPGDDCGTHRDEADEPDGGERRVRNASELLELNGELRRLRDGVAGHQQDGDRGHEGQKRPDAAVPRPHGLLRPGTGRERRRNGDERQHDGDDIRIGDETFGEVGEPFTHSTENSEHTTDHGSDFHQHTEGVFSKNPSDERRSLGKPARTRPKRPPDLPSIHRDVRPRH